MNRIAYFVDGFNLYHALDGKDIYRKYKWLNLKKLAHCFASQHDQIVKVFYFTAYATWAPEKVKRHQIYVKALQSVGAEVILGKFKYKERLCRNCKTRYPTFEEKETDVHIATKLFQSAAQDRIGVQPSGFQGDQTTALKNGRGATTTL
ncbi:NYN domain-containing protein [Elusimicrobiota bacterium]